MQLAQTRPFYYFSLLLDPFGPGSALSISRLFYCIFISHTFSKYHFKAYDLFFGTGSSLIILRRVSAPR